VTEKFAPKVLVVDDHDDTRRVMRWMLEQRGYRVTEASDGREAVAAALRERPDLILMDLSMPGLDGFEAIRGVRGHAELSGIPAVAVTGRDTAGSRDGAESAGFDYYLSKPIDYLRLGVVMEKLLGGSATRRQ
jgi:CheY-like chemotaxis protein